MTLTHTLTHIYTQKDEGVKKAVRVMWWCKDFSSDTSCVKKQLIVKVLPPLSPEYIHYSYKHSKGNLKPFFEGCSRGRINHTFHIEVCFFFYMPQQEIL